MKALFLMLLVAGCSSFPCSPQNPCAPGDGGASMRDAARVVIDASRPAYYPPSQSRMTTCTRTSGNTVLCW